MNPDNRLGLALDRDGDRPIYQQLYTQLRDQIRAGDRYPSGARLPSTRRLAQELGLSRNTVSIAYRRLHDDGLVRTLAGGGTVVVAAREREASRRAAHAPRPDLLSGRGRELALRTPPRGLAAAGGAFAAGPPPTDLFPVALWAALTSRRLRLSGRPALLGAQPAGLRPLREAIAAHLAATRAVLCDPRRVLVTRGIESGIELVGRALLDAGAQAWCEEPGYPGIGGALGRAGLRVHPVPVDREGLDVDAAIAAAPDARLAVLCPARHAPTGAILSAPRRERLREHAQRTGMWIVECEPDAAFLAADPPPLITAEPSSRTIHLGTFDTLLFPGLHVGYCVVPEEVAQPCAQVLGASADTPSALAQAVLADFLDDHRAARAVARIRAAARARRGAVRDALVRLGLGNALRGATNSGAELSLALPGRARESAAASADTALALRPYSWYFTGEPTESGIVIGCAAVREDAAGPAVRALAPLLSEP